MFRKDPAYGLIVSAEKAIKINGSSFKKIGLVDGKKDGERGMPSIQKSLIYKVIIKSVKRSPSTIHIDNKHKLSTLVVD